ncbi:hypothetical protein FNH22_25560 [Fulvivirga sp. M361]|uniref:hypothetical protein n=1 Tax=Fulvivirga sp. M361 TaxID=2594266 RepID=UPI001179F382|nr:hypothetical protein [Fulvivirga sp. M361]TRX50412.1 hypothetical protein FNH22_25560 [Fulvivirga sp. M361]
MIFPRKRETVVLPITTDEVLIKLARVTRAVSLLTKKEGPQHLFNGTITNAQFTLSLRIDYPNNYIPLIKGRFEDSSRGCILFLSYDLFFSSLLFLVFWSVLSVLISLFLFFYAQESTYAFIALSGGLANYVVTLMNFKKQFFQSKQLLLDVLVSEDG